MRRSVIRSATYIAVGLLLVGTLVSAAEAGNRKFYLTPDRVDGSQALTACAPGYHMASLWEIHEPSNLTYNTKLGLTEDDSGSGPPASIGGWIRTGVASSNSTNVGVGNCSAWTSQSSGDRGTVLFLSAAWLVSSTNVSPWDAGLGACNTPNLVWCVSGK